MPLSIRFLGAAGTVTGSRHLVEVPAGSAGRVQRILLDCGLFQGRKSLRVQNWEEFPVAPDSIDAVVLSHSHIDHTGWLPRLIDQGFSGPVYATPATRDLLAIVLPDSGRLQEEDARRANRKGYTKHAPALPLYTEDAANNAIGYVRAVPHASPREIGDGIRLTYHRAGHILGSAFVQLDIDVPGEQPHRIIFSGDLGRPGTPIIPDPDPVDRATTLLVECTYADRLHEAHHPLSDLADAVQRMVENKGVLIIPAFAIGRTQHILYYLRELQAQGRLPALPVFVDSPMACNATPLYLMHREEHDEDMRELVLSGEEPLHPEHVEFTRSVARSRAINKRSGPMIIISASGMATGGRVLHHLRQRLPDPNTTVLFVGYQASGTRGRRMLEGEKEIRIHGRDVPVRARVAQIYGFSGHADYSEVDKWLATMKSAPRRTFCVHGEEEGLEAMRARLEERGWPAYVPAHGELVEL